MPTYKARPTGDTYTASELRTLLNNLADDAETNIRSINLSDEFDKATLTEDPITCNMTATDLMNLDVRELCANSGTIYIQDLLNAINAYLSVGGKVTDVVSLDTVENVHLVPLDIRFMIGENDSFLTILADKGNNEWGSDHKPHHWDDPKINRLP